MKYKNSTPNVYDKYYVTSNVILVIALIIGLYKEETTKVQKNNT